MSWPLVTYVLKGVLKDRFILSVLGIFTFCAALSLFFGLSAVTEQGQFFLVFFASAMRLVGVILLILFIASFTRRSFDRRDVDFLLTKPLSRAGFIFSHNIAFCVLATIMAGGAFLALMPCVLLVDVGHENLFRGAVLWGVGIWSEYLVMALLTFFVAVMMKSPVTSILSAIGFYVLARMMGGVMGIIAAEKNTGAVSAFLEQVLVFISVFVPRFDLTAQSGWLLYGVENIDVHSFPVIQLLVFSALVVTATIWDFNRKEF